MLVKDFVYQLPNELIAQIPPAIRTASRLLYLDGKTGAIEHQTFSQFPNLIQPGDLLVLNDTRVIPARLFGRKETGGRIEILVERIIGPQEILAHVRSNKSLKADTRIFLETQKEKKTAGQKEEQREEQIDQPVEVLVLGRGERNPDLFYLKFLITEPIYVLLERVGHMPLPPYMTRADNATDRERYQTVYSEAPGAVAAPTAGLHFDIAMLQGLRAKGVQIATVTLHVGAGTFQPVKVERIEDHVMHFEWMMVSADVCKAVAETRARGGRVIAIGTTSVRCLETAAISGTLKPYAGETNLFIYPGFNFQVVNAMLTNFHLPASTLLMLVCAFAGRENVFAAYEAAIANQYRFFSYGDAMFVTRKGIQVG